MERVVESISRHIESRAPDFLKALNKICIKHYSKNCVELFIEEPEKLRDLLLKYNDTPTAKFIIKHLFIQPTVRGAGKENCLETLSQLFIEDTKKFKEELQKTIQNTQQKT